MFLNLRLRAEDERRLSRSAYRLVLFICIYVYMICICMIYIYFTLFVCIRVSWHLALSRFLEGSNKSMDYSSLMNNDPNGS